MARRTVVSRRLPTARTQLRRGAARRRGVLSRSVRRAPLSQAAGDYLRLVRDSPHPSSPRRRHCLLSVGRRARRGLSPSGGFRPHLVGVASPLCSHRANDRTGATEAAGTRALSEGGAGRPRSIQPRPSSEGRHHRRSHCLRGRNGSHHRSGGSVGLERPSAALWN